MPGRFLELGLAAADVAASLAYWDSLGFVQAPVGEAWPHPYAVVTDGRLHLGLHGTALEGPLLTFVAPDLARRLEALERTGIAIEHARLDGGALDEVQFQDPAGLRVRLLEARTYSPPPVEPGFESALGWFEAWIADTREPRRAGAFWEALGLVAFEEPDPDGTARVSVAHRDLRLEFHDRDLQGPMPWFSAPDMRSRVAALRDRGFRFATRVPNTLADRGAAILQAPDGLRILLSEPAG